MIQKQKEYLFEMNANTRLESGKARNEMNANML
jgi:hypothetical protein